MAGAPSQLELFEHKPELKRFDGQDCPASLLAGKRFAFISGVPKLFGSQFPFHQAGQSGQWISDRLPQSRETALTICVSSSPCARISSIMLPHNYWSRPGIHALDMRRLGRGWFMDWALRTRICQVSSCCFPVETPGWRKAIVGFGLFARRVPGSAVPLPWRACALSRQSSTGKPGIAPEHVGRHR